MSGPVYIISLVNVICCLILLVLQIPRFMDAQTKMRHHWITPGEYLLEAFKLIAYSGGIGTYIVLPCYQECFKSVRKNFKTRYFVFAILLIVMSFIDGTTRRLYHVVAFSIFNLCASIYVCNSELRDRDESESRGNNSTEMCEMTPQHFEV